MAESSDKTLSTGEGNGKPHQYTFCENLMNCIKAQKCLTPKMSAPGLKVSSILQGKSRGELPVTPRMKETAGPSQIRCSVVAVSGDESKLCCCKEQYCIGTWNLGP